MVHSLESTDETERQKSYCIFHEPGAFVSEPAQLYNPDLTNPVPESVVSLEPLLSRGYQREQTIHVNLRFRSTTFKKHHTDFPLTDETVGLILWSSTELTVTILTATIPTLRPLYKQLFALSKNRSRSFRLGEHPSYNGQPHFTPYTNSVKASVEVGQSSTSDRSDKSILGHGGNGSIVCTDVVYVQFEERSDPQTPESDRWNKRHCQTWNVV
jgi:hypothetical protein